MRFSFICDNTKIKYKISIHKYNYAYCYYSNQHLQKCEMCIKFRYKFKTYTITAFEIKEYPLDLKNEYLKKLDEKLLEWDSKSDEQFKFDVEKEIIVKINKIKNTRRLFQPIKKRHIDTYNRIKNRIKKLK